MARYVDIAADRPSVGLCVVLPGRQYTADAPLLFFATHAALAHGWDVRQVWWEAPERGSGHDELTWVGEQLDEAVADHTGRVLVVAKSLGTLAATRAAACGYDGAWLTPLLTDAEAVAPPVTYPAAQYVVIGSSDPFLDRDVLEDLPRTRLLVDGDHVLRVPGDAVAMASSHERFARSFDAWLESLARDAESI